MITRFLRRIFWMALPLALFALAALVIWRVEPAQPGVQINLNCPRPDQGCATRIGAREVSIGIEGEVAPLTPFRIWAKAPGAGKVQARFTMQGMDMGFNLYTLRPDAEGVFRADVTLPICVTGRRDWVMTVEIDGAALNLPFKTR